jgi:hypothetical protein
MGIAAPGEGVEYRVVQHEAILGDRLRLLARPTTGNG